MQMTSAVSHFANPAGCLAFQDFSSEVQEKEIDEREFFMNFRDRLTDAAALVNSSGVIFISVSH